MCIRDSTHTHTHTLTRTQISPSVKTEDVEDMEDLTEDMEFDPVHQDDSTYDSYFSSG